MLSVLWLVLFAVGICLILTMPLLWGGSIYSRYRGIRAVTCPETQRPAAVRLDALKAAISGISGTPVLRLAGCSRWMERGRCDQDCLSAATQVAPYTEGEVARPRTKAIYHLPVVMGGFAAWVFGAFWHSQHFLRQRWMTALGLDPLQLRHLVRSWSPHLLSVAACFLFAYGVAGVLLWTKQRGTFAGIASALLLWLALAAASLVGTQWAGLSPALIGIEMSYTFLAAVMVGAIIGGLEGRLLVTRLGG